MGLPQKTIDSLPVRDGTRLYCETILGSNDTWLIRVHGIGEHIGRGTRLSELFAESYNIFQYDLRGHGQSEGRRGYVDSFSHYYLDLQDVVTHLASTNPNFRYRLFGHSMGALIAAGFVQNLPEGTPTPDTLFLASPPIGLGGRAGALANRLPRRFIAALARISISVPFASMINCRYLSHDENVVGDLLRDPLSLKRLHSKLLFGLVDASRRVFSRPIAAPCPLHAAIGSNDRIVSYTAAQRYFATHEPDADLRIIDAAYHELHNETAPYREPYFAYLKQAFARN